MLWLCYKLPSCLFGNTRGTSVMHEKVKCVCFHDMQPQKLKFKSVQINMKHVSYWQRLQRAKQRVTFRQVIYVGKSELPWPIPLNSVESDHGCTSRIYFDNAVDNVTLTIYNVTLTSQKPC